MGHVAAAACCLPRQDVAAVQSGPGQVPKCPLLVVGFGGLRKALVGPSPKS